MPGSWMSIRMSSRHEGLEQLQRLLGVDRGARVVAFAREQHPRELQVRGVVVDDEDRLTRHRAPPACPTASRTRAAGSAKNVLPLPSSLSTPTGPALRLDDPLGEREAEARAGVLLRRAGVELLELDEQPVHVLAPMPMPVSSTSRRNASGALGAPRDARPARPRA